MKHRKAGKLPLALLLVCCVFLFVLVPVASAVQSYKEADFNHYDWPNSCIMAYDVTFTNDEYTAAKSMGTVEDVILSRTDGTISYGPTRAPYENGFAEVDTYLLPQSATSGTYSVTLFMSRADRSQDYIVINVNIEKPVVTPEPEPEPEPQPTPEEPKQTDPIPDSAVQNTQTESPKTEEKEEIPQTEPQEEPKTDKPAKKPIKKPAAIVTKPDRGPSMSPIPEAEEKGFSFPKYTRIIMYIASGISLLWLLLLLIPAFRVIKWHKRKKEEHRQTKDDDDRTDGEGNLC